MKPIEKINKVLLFNPVSIVHARNMSIFRNFMPDFKLRCIYNPNLPWFSDMEKNFNDEIVYFRGKHYRVQGCNMETGFPGRWILSVPEFYQKSIPPNFQHCKYPIHDLSNLAAENLPLSVR